MKRRGFLKLLAATLASAGVSTTTVLNIFGTPKANKLEVGEAIRRVVKRFDTAKTPEEIHKIAYDALRIMTEAHRDHSLVWAGGAVLYYAQLNGNVNMLIKVTTEHKRTPGIKEFLEGLRTVLCHGGDVARATLYRYETAMACREMGGEMGYDLDIRYGNMIALKKHHPGVYAKHLKDHPQA